MGQYTNVHDRGQTNEYFVMEIEPLCPSPTKGTPLLSSGLKPGVLRGGGDKKRWTNYLTLCKSQRIISLTCVEYLLLPATRCRCMSPPMGKKGCNKGMRLYVIYCCQWNLSFFVGSPIPLEGTTKHENSRDCYFQRNMPG